MRKLREEEEDRAFAHWMKNIHVSKGASRIAGSSSGCRPNQKCLKGFECIPNSDYVGNGILDFNDTYRHLPVEEIRCAEMCTEMLNCNAYEYSKKEEKCKLLALPNGNRERFADYTFCRKNNVTCSAGYTRKTGSLGKESANQWIPV